MRAVDVVNFYIENPPFELSDQNSGRYLQLINSVTQLTLHELSYCNPIIEETTFTTPSSTTSYVLIDIYDTVSSSFMDFLLLQPKQQALSLIPSLLKDNSLALKRAIEEASLISYIAVRDAWQALREWSSTQKSYLKLSGRKIKLLPLTEYYCIYTRFKNGLDEVYADELKTFKELFELNLLLSMYQSDWLVKEGGIRSISLSGLSVSFNTADAGQTIREVKTRKDSILAATCLDYDDMIGLV